MTDKDNIDQLAMQAAAAIEEQWSVGELSQFLDQQPDWFAAKTAQIAAVVKPFLQRAVSDLRAELAMRPKAIVISAKQPLEPIRLDAMPRAVGIAENYEVTIVGLDGLEWKFAAATCVVTPAAEAEYTVARTRAGETAVCVAGIKVVTPDNDAPLAMSAEERAAEEAAIRIDEYDQERNEGL